MVIAYISNLTAFLLARQPSSPVVPFKTWEEMTIQSSVNYGVKNGGIMHRLMRESVDSTLKHAIQNIETFGTFFNTDKEGIEMVRKSDGNFAAIVSSDMGNKYVDSEPCDLMYVGATVERTPYGIACKTKTICNSLSSALLSCIEDGSVHLLNVKWFSSLKRCPSYKLKDYVSKQETAKLAARPLTIADTSLAFVVLLLGVILCILFLVIEVVVSRRRSEVSYVCDTFSIFIEILPLFYLTKIVTENEEPGLQGNFSGRFVMNPDEGFFMLTVNDMSISNW